MIVAVLAITRRTGSHRLLDLLDAIDPDAPSPVTLLSPEGEPVFILVAKIHHPYAAVCARLGYECKRIVFAEFPDFHYARRRTIDLRAHKWLNVFLSMWLAEYN